ncbi:hypothetical protein D3C73_1533430 [compost metagenome]
MDAAKLYQRLEGASGHFLREVLCKFGPNLYPVGARQRSYLLAGGLCLRPAGVPFQEAVVQPDAGHDHDSVSCHAGAAVYDVQLLPMD